MTRSKWYEIYDQEFERHRTGFVTVSPDTWEHNKSILLKYIETIDELNEVYNMENKGE